ncbi:hypothetical protein M5K25_015201 [Dendrobium thyrsiflorum]|uniref:Uncharacterized protein n=1 Tax=Dendrobium thyrsiflorum TaxID=117978 RepID=A0ABD0UWH6_DENTH
MSLSKSINRIHSLHERDFWVQKRLERVLRFQELQHHRRRTPVDCRWTSTGRRPSADFHLANTRRRSFAGPPPEARHPAGPPLESQRPAEPPPEARRSTKLSPEADTLPDYHLRLDVLSDHHLRPDVLPDHHLDAGLSLGQRLWSFRPPSPTTVLPTSIAESWSLRHPPPVDNGLSDLCRTPTMVLSSSFADYGAFDLHRQTTVCPTTVTCRLRSLRPLLPTMVLPTSIAHRQRSFRPPSSTDLCRLWSCLPNKRVNTNSSM